MPRPLSVTVRRPPFRFRLQRDLDAGGMARHRLVHAVVEHLGGEMMKRALVGAADIHARAAADRLQPFEHLDRMGVIIGGRRGGGSEQVFGHGEGYRGRGVGGARFLGCSVHRLRSA